MKQLLKKLTHGKRHTGAAPSALAFPDAAAAENYLKALAPIPTGTIQADNRITPQYDLHIIVPCYNVARTIVRCVDSILSQKTGYTFFVSLVNDGSTDKTPELLERYRADPRVEILTQSNRGLSGARNRALEHIRGKYILFVDSDDTLRKGAVEALLSKAVETNADIVQGGFVNITGHGLVFGRTGYREGSAAETGQTPYGMAWGKVIRSSLFAHLKFPEGYWFEDTIFAFCIAPFQPTHYLIPAYVYNYTRNPLGITLRSRKKAKAVDTVWIMQYLMAELAQKKEVHSAQVQQLLLQHIALAWYRLSRLDEAVQQAAFLVMQQMYAAYYAPQDICVQDSRLLALHQALAVKNYGQYLAAAENLT